MSALRSFRRNRGRRYWFWGATFVAVAIFGVVFVASSGASLSTSPFEGADGNMVVDQAGHTDWESLSSPVLRTLTDIPSGTSDNSFTQGTKEDNPNVTIATGSIPPNKNDLTRAYAASETFSDETFLYLAWERQPNPNGSANIDFELDQNATAGDFTQPGDLTINRTEGDILITYDFGGSGTPDLGLLTWLTAGNGHSNSDCQASGATIPCWGNRIDLNPNSNPPAEAAVNSTTIDEVFAGGTLTTGSFGEAKIDLSEVPGLFTGGTCKAFGNMFVKSRSSGSSIDAELKDFIAPVPIQVSNCASPEVATQTSLSSMTVGQTETVGDTATLTNGNNPTGDVAFQLYSDAACQDAVASVGGSAPLVNGVATFAGASFTPTHTGTFYWGVSYPGDDNNNGVSACGGDNEEIVVGKASPSVSTTQDPDSGAIGATFKDTATLSDAVSLDGTGSIEFNLYSAQNCIGPALDTETVDNISANGDYSTPAGFQIENAGTYYWVASFSGDSNNNAFTSGCNDEPVVIAQNQPSVATTQDPASGLIGAMFNDTASLSGGVNYDGSGSIEFKLYDAAECDGTVLDTETVDNITANGDYSTPNGFQIQNAGTYYWVASFTGDSNNLSFTSGCNDEPVQVAQNQPSVSTTQDPASGSIGATYKDTATLSDGENLDGSGSITFTLYDAADCEGNVLDTETVDNIDANGDYSTPNGFAIQNAGTYYWVAHFSGDSNNLPFTSGCNDEPVEVAPNTPTITTLLSQSSVNVGTAVHDSAALAGVTGNAGGTVAYSVYSDSTCSTKVADGGTVSVANGAVPNSSDVTFNTPGTFYWQASYSGDANNTSALSACTDEKLVVAPLIDLAVTKAGSPASQELGTGNITWTIVVTNNGPSTATGVTIADPMPGGNTFVSAAPSQGSCTGGAILNCSLGTIAAGGTVTITLVTTPSTEGNQTNTVTVAGNETETNTANNTASATVFVAAPHKPQVFCVAVSKVTPSQLFVGRKTKLTIRVTQHGQAVKGVHVRIKGPKIDMRTAASSAKGVITQSVKLKKAGILIFSPIASKRCNTKRVGVTGVFTPPVTG